MLTAKIKDFTFVCVGGGDVDYLKQEVKKSGLEKYFEIIGRMQDMEKVEKILLSCGVAVAPYYPEDKNNFSYYADPGKVKIYLGCGLPVVITDVPPVARSVVRHKAGLLAEYNAKDVAMQIQCIISSEQTYRKFQKNALRFGKECEWRVIYKKAIENIL